MAKRKDSEEDYAQLHGSDQESVTGKPLESPEFSGYYRRSSHSVSTSSEYEDDMESAAELQFLHGIAKCLRTTIQYDVRSHFTALRKITKETFPRTVTVDVTKDENLLNTDIADRMAGADEGEIDLTQFHEDFDGKTVNHVMVVGDVGSGKSIIAKKYAQLASEKKVKSLRHIRMVHFIQVQALQNEKKSTAFNLIVTQQVTQIFDEDVLKAGERWMIRNADKILLVIDGLDQCQEPFEGAKCKQIGYMDQVSANTILANIFTGHLFEGMKILSTSRWFSYWQLTAQQKPSVTVALRGFDDNAFRSIITQLSNNPEKIMKYLQEKVPDLLPLCKTPAFAVYITAIFSQKVENPPDRFSSVMISLLRFFIRSKHMDATDIANTDTLARLGFTSMIDNRFSFTARYLRNKLSIDHRKLQGPIIKSALPLPGAEKIMEDDIQVQFLHQSVQELYASLHLFNMKEDEFEKVASDELNKPNMDVVQKLFYGIVMNPTTNRLSLSLIQDKPISLDKCKEVLWHQLSLMLDKSPLTDMKTVALLHECGEEVLTEFKDKIQSIRITERSLKPGEDYALTSVMKHSLPIDKVEVYYLLLNANIVRALVTIAKDVELFMINHVQIGERILPEDHGHIKRLFQEVPLQSVVLQSTNDVAKSFLEMPPTAFTGKLHRLALRGKYSNEIFQLLGRFISRLTRLRYLRFWQVDLTHENIDNLCQEISPFCQVERVGLQDDKNADPVAYGKLPEMLRKLNSKFIIFLSCNLNQQKMAAFNEYAKKINLQLDGFGLLSDEDATPAFAEISVAIELLQSRYILIGLMKVTKKLLRELCNAVVKRAHQVKKLGFPMAQFPEAEDFCEVANFMMQACLKSLYVGASNLTPEMLQLFANRIQEQNYQFPFLHIMERKVIPMELFQGMADLICIANIKELILGANEISHKQVSILRHDLEERNSKLASVALHSLTGFSEEVVVAASQLFSCLGKNRGKDVEYEEEEIVSRDISDFAWTLQHGLVTKAKCVAISNGRMPDVSAMQHMAAIISHPVLEMLWMDEFHLSDKHFMALLGFLDLNDKYSKLRRLILSQAEMDLSNAEVLALSQLVQSVVLCLELRGVQLDFTDLEVLQRALDCGERDNTEIILERKGIAMILKRGCGSEIFVYESIDKEVCRKGATITLAGSMVVSIPKGLIGTKTTISVKSEVDSSKWPRLQGYRYISPMLYVGGFEPDNQPVSVQMGTWCVNGDLKKKATIKVLHLPRSSEEWEVINTQPFDDSPIFKFSCSNFSPVIIAVPAPSSNLPRFNVEGTLHVKRGENNFIMSFRPQNRPDPLPAICRLNHVADINTVHTNIDDRIKVIVSSAQDEFYFHPRSEMEFTIDEDFTNSKRKVQFQFAMSRRGNDQCPFEVHMRYQIYKNNEPFGTEQGFNYVWRSTLGHTNVLPSTESIAMRRDQIGDINAQVVVMGQARATFHYQNPVNLPDESVSAGSSLQFAPAQTTSCTTTSPARSTQTPAYDREVLPTTEASQPVEQVAGIQSELPSSSRTSLGIRNQSSGNTTTPKAIYDDDELDDHDDDSEASTSDSSDG